MIIEIKTEKSVETNSVGLIDTLSYNPGLSKFLYQWFRFHPFDLPSVICTDRPLVISLPIPTLLTYTHTPFTFHAPSLFCIIPHHITAATAGELATLFHHNRGGPQQPNWHFLPESHIADAGFGPFAERRTFFTRIQQYKQKNKTTKTWFRSLKMFTFKTKLVGLACVR